MTISRRTALVSMAAAAASAAEGGKRTPIRLGGPIFLKSDDPRELAREHRRLGYSAAYCPEASSQDSTRIKAIKDAYAKENVIIAEVGAWRNMLDPDPNKRSANLRYVTERLGLAEAVGARCCVDIAGSFNPDVWYGPDPKNLTQEFFDATVENCRRVIDAIKPTQTAFSIEMMPWSLPDGPDNYLRLIKAVDRKAFGVHLDVCNVINSPTRYYENGKVITECFRVLGPRIISCHAKDLYWAMEYNVHFVEVPPGRGQIDYRTYLTQLAQLQQDAPLMLEHLKKPEEYDEARAFILKTGRGLGLNFA